MRRFVLFALISSPVFGQAIIDDWKCGIATAAASKPGGPTTITCSGPHGFSNGQHVLITNATGKWAPLNTQWEVVLKYTISSTGTTMYVNDTSQMDATPGGVWQIYPETYYAQCDGGVENVTMVSVNDDRSLTVKRAPNASPHCNEDKMWGPSNRQNTWTVTTSGPAAKTFTVPLDSSSFGSFTGQSVSVVRSWSYPYEPADYYYYDSADGSPIAMSMTNNGYQQFTIDGCPDKTDPIRCSFGYGDPVNQKGYMDYQTVNNLVVSGGVGTINLTAPFAQTGLTAQTRKFQTNELFWLWNMVEPNATFGAINRPWIISGIGNGNQTITVNGMGAAGVPDGTYVPNAGSYKNFIFPIMADFYTGLGSPGNVNSYGYPAGFVQSMLKPSGTPFSKTMNRYRAWIQWGAAMNKVPMEWGTYIWEQPSGTAYHGYHTVSLDTVPNEWEQEEFAAVPAHFVGSSPMVPQGADPTYNGWSGYAPWTGETTHYLDGYGSAYMNLSSIYSLVGGQTGLVGPMYLDTTSNEPDEWTPIRATRYNPATGTYHLNVVSASNPIAPVVANIYYSTIGDIRNIGIAAATAIGSATAAPTGASAVNQWNYDTPALARQSQIWFAVRPIMPISGVSGAGQSPIVVSFDYDPNMAVNDHVTIAGVGGNTAANCGNCQIVKVYPRQLWFHMVPTTKPPASQGPLNSIISDGSVCTAIMGQTTNLVPGWRIGVSGVPTGGPGNITGYGASGVTWFNVTGAVGNSFTFACPGTVPGTYNTDANPGGGQFMSIVADPAIAIAGTGTSNWDGNFTGTMVSSENNRNFTEINFQPPASVGIPLVNSLQCNPGVIAPGGSSTCTVAINQSEPRMPVYIKNSNAAAVKAPSTVMVIGQTAKFTVTAAAGFTGSVTLRAHYNASGQDFVLVVGGDSARPAKPSGTAITRVTGVIRPQVAEVAAPPAPKMISLECLPKAAHPGENMRCEAGLDISPSTSLSMKLSAGNSALMIPQTIAVRAGQSKLAFYAQVAPGSRQPAATLQAVLGDSIAEEHVLLLPSVSSELKTPGPQYVHPGDTLSFALANSDGDAPSRVVASGLPRGASFDGDARLFTWSPDSSQTGSYEVSFTGTGADRVARTGAVRIEVGSGKPVAEEIRNAASQSGAAACSPNSLATVSGKWLVNGNAAHATPAGAFEVAGARVKVDGKPARIVSASPERIDFVCPNQSSGTSQVVVETEGGTTEPLSLPMRDATPAVFSLDGSGRGQGRILSSETALVAMPRNPVVAGAPAQPGDPVSLRVTGVPEDATLRVLIGGLPARATRIRPVPELAGVSEIQVDIPEGTPIADDVPVRLEVESGGRTLQSNTVTMAIEAAN